MANILLVTSSPRGGESVSTKVAKAVVDTLVAKHPGSTVVTRDLGADPLPHIDGSFLGALFTPAEARSADQATLSDRSQAVIDEVMAADYLVIGVALINFGTPTTLRAWIDHLVRAGVTFKYTEAGPVGLIDGAAKKVYFVEARGGLYPGEAANHLHSSNYIKGVLAFLGIHNSELITAEGLAYGPEAAEKAVTGALAEAKLVA